MIDYTDDIRIARGLAAGEIGGGPLGRPREAELRRAVSVAYYAMFHALCQTCADMLVGASRANRSQRAWVQAYRAPDHGTVRSRCNRAEMNEFPPAIRDFGKLLVELQAMRHRADYAPFYGVQIKREFVMNLIDGAETAIDRLLETPAYERRAFVVYVLLPIRND